MTDPTVLYARDCVVFFKGDSQTVAVSDDMVTKGWPGGQGVQWSHTSQDDRIVTFSTGLYGGFLVWGSDETGDQYTAVTKQQPAYRYATMFSGGCLITTSSYERYTYASRIGGGGLVALTYAANDPLFFSLRGLWTKEDELTVSGSAKAPAFFSGFVSLVPRASNNRWLGIQTSL